MHSSEYSRVYRTISNVLAEKGVRASAHQDAQHGTVMDAPSPHQFRQLVLHLWALSPRDSAATRDLSMFLFMTMTMGR